MLSGVVHKPKAGTILNSRKLLPGEIDHGVEEGCDKDAPACVVVEPDNDDPSCHRPKGPPGNEHQRAVCFEQRDDMPNGPHHPEKKSAPKCAKARLQGID